MKNILFFCLFLPFSLSPTYLNCNARSEILTAIQITQEGAEIPEWVIIDGVKWATRNVDAPGTFVARPEDAGMSYKWNSKIGLSNTEPDEDIDEGNTMFMRHMIDDTWEKANDHCPSGWHVPTDIELKSLANAAKERTTLNGVDGRIFGSDDNLLFLPIDAYGSSNGTGYLVDGGAWCSFIMTTSAIGKHRAVRFKMRCVAE